jgi:hypothetical protein
VLNNISSSSSLDSLLIKLISIGSKLELLFILLVIISSSSSFEPLSMRILLAMDVVMNHC